MISYFINKLITFICSIFDFIKSSFIWFLLHDYLQRNYPNEIDNFKVQITYKCIYYFSKFQLFWIKMKNRVQFEIDNNNTLKNIVNAIHNIKNECNMKNKLTKFKNGELQASTYTNNIIDNYDNDSLYIYSINENDKTNHIILRSQNIPEKYETSSTKFIMVELQLNNNKFKIDLQTEKDNYYIEENILDKVFFLYYMFINLQKYKENTYDEISSYIEYGVVKIIDENVNIAFFCELLDT